MNPLQASRIHSRQDARRLPLDRPAMHHALDAVVGQSAGTDDGILQRLVDESAVRAFDQRMEASMTKSLEAIFNGSPWLTAAEIGRAARPGALV